MLDRKPRLTWIAAAAVALALVLGSPVHAAPPRAEKADAAAPVDINKASASELETVPGIGKSLARRIVSFREKNGAFAKVDDLLKIQGIGEKSLEKLRPYLTVSRTK